jgi:soluble lytic murein transglycosylase-like protein
MPLYQSALHTRLFAALALFALALAWELQTDGPTGVEAPAPPNPLLAARAEAAAAPEEPADPAELPAASTVTLPEGGNMHWFIRTQEIARNYGLGDMFVRQIKQESHFRDDIISGQFVSWAGAVGIAQIVPWMHPEVNPLDPEASLHYAAKLMNEHITRYGGDKAKALAAYNAGPGTVDWTVETCAATWRDCLPDETKEYLANIHVPDMRGAIIEGRPPSAKPAVKPQSGWLSFLEIARQHGQS